MYDSKGVTTHRLITSALEEADTMASAIILQREFGAVRQPGGIIGTQPV